MTRSRGVTCIGVIEVVSIDSEKVTEMELLMLTAVAVIRRGGSNRRRSGVGGCPDGEPVGLGVLTGEGVSGTVFDPGRDPDLVGRRIGQVRCRF